MTRHRLKTFTLNLLLLSLGLLAAMAVVELGVRVLGLHDPQTDAFVEPHPRLGWSHVPNKVGHWTIGETRIPIQINSKGLRDREYGYEKEAGTFRILVLGDSFTEAFQVPLSDTFCKVLEHNLNDGQGGFQVINAGLGGVGTDYALHFLREEGVKYDPDLVLVAFFPNDIIDNFKSRELLDHPQAVETVYYGKRGLLTDVKQFLAGHSHAFNFFGSTVVNRIPALRNFLTDVGLIGAAPNRTGHEGIPLHLLVLENEYSAEMRQAWEITDRLFAGLAGEARSQGSQLAVISIPLREQVYEFLWTAYMERPKMKERQWNRRKPDELLTETLRKLDIPLLPLLSEFKTASQNEPLYFGVRGKVADGHWTSAGHRLAARLIEQWLIQKGLIPR